MFKSPREHHLEKIEYKLAVGVVAIPYEYKGPKTTMRYISVEQIAKDLGVSERTVQRYCNEGIIQSERTWIKNHFVHKIPANEYYEWKFRQKNHSSPSTKDTH